MDQRIIGCHEERCVRLGVAREGLYTSIVSIVKGFCGKTCVTCIGCFIFPMNYLCYKVNYLCCKRKKTKGLK
jgi:hypothetical protein